MKYKNKQVTYKPLLFSLLLIMSQNSMGAVPGNGRFYTGDDTVRGGTMGVINLATAAGYTSSDLIHMANEYWPPVTSINFAWSTLTVDAFGNIFPDPVSGYDGNVAYISANYFPGTWDGVAVSYNEFGQACLTLSNLTTANPSSSATGRCVSPRNVTTQTSPNIAYGAIYINTNGDSSMTPLQDKRRSIAIHEMGHIIGLGHSTTCSSTTNSVSVMDHDTDPSVCLGGVTTLQADDITRLNAIY